MFSDDRRLLKINEMGMDDSQSMHTALRLYQQTKIDSWVEEKILVSLVSKYRHVINDILHEIISPYYY